MTDPKVTEALQLALSIGTLLAGKPQDVRGAALAQVLAYWLVSHTDGTVREALLIEHIKGVRRMMVVLDKEKHDA